MEIIRSIAEYLEDKWHAEDVREYHERLKREGKPLPSDAEPSRRRDEQKTTSRGPGSEGAQPPKRRSTMQEPHMQPTIRDPVAMPSATDFRPLQEHVDMPDETQFGASIHAARALHSSTMALEQRPRKHRKSRSQSMPYERQVSGQREQHEPKDRSRGRSRRNEPDRQGQNSKQEGNERKEARNVSPKNPTGIFCFWKSSKIKESQSVPTPAPHPVYNTPRQVQTLGAGASYSTILHRGLGDMRRSIMEGFVRKDGRDDEDEDTVEKK